MNKQLVLFIILILIIITILYNTNEYFTTDTEALANIASLYNSGNFTLTNASITNDLNVNGLLTASGDAKMNSNVYIEGNAQMNKNLIVNGDTNLNKNITIGGQAQIGNNLSVGGDTQIKNNLMVNNNLSVDGETKVKKITVGDSISFAGYSMKNGRLIRPLNIKGLYYEGNEINEYGKIESEDECIERCLFKEDKNHPHMSEMTRAITYNFEKKNCNCLRNGTPLKFDGSKKTYSFELLN